jgi:polygalacturonase
MLPAQILSAQSTYNVKDYGAQGDGSTNDTNAVQAAINAARAAGSGTVYFPSSGGCYLVSSLTAYSNIDYSGQSESVCIQGSSNNASIFVTASGSAFSNSRISDLTFTGNGTGSSGAACIWLGGPTNVIIDHVTATKCAGDGFYITGYGSNLATPGDGLLVKNSIASYSGRNGMSIITGMNITVRGSVFEYNNIGAPYDGVDIEPNNSSQTVENITFENCSFLNNGNSGSTASGHNGFNVWETYANLPNLNLRLIHCRFKGNLRDGLYAAGSGHTLSGIYVIDGSMANNQAMNGYRGGVDIWNTSNVVVSNVQVSSPASSGQAVYFSGVSGAVVANSKLSAGAMDLNTNSSTGAQVYTSTTLVQGTHAGSYSMPSGTAPAIAATHLPAGTHGVAYSVTLMAAGDAPITWTTVAATGNSLPPGMTFSSGGVLSGTPAAPGTYTFTAQATNDVSFDERTFTLTIN